MACSVWLMTRPLSLATLLPPLALTSNAKSYLRHWAILINDMSIMDLRAILLRTHAYCGADDIELGTVYELFRDENDYNNVHIDAHFGMAAIKKEWRMFSIQYVGETSKTSEEIKAEGGQYQERPGLIVAIRIVEAHPDYRLFENNCQNFVKSLLQFVCPHASIPATIQSVLQRLQDVSDITKGHYSSIPGGYPPTLVSLHSSDTKETQSTWFTASGTSWLTAKEYIDMDSTGCESRSYPHSGAKIAGIRLRSNPRAVIRSFPARVHKGLHGNAALIRAVRIGDFEMVAALMRLNANVNARDGLGKTALHWAVNSRDGRMTKMLIDAGSDVSLRDNQGRTALHTAILEGYFTTINALLDTDLHSCISAKDCFGHTALHLATKQGMATTVEALVKAGCDISATDDYGRTALYEAVGVSNGVIARMLLDAGSDVAIKDDSGRTPLHHATERANGTIVKMLLDAGADIDAQDDDGWTPLHWATWKDNVMTVQLLLDAGSDVSIVTMKRETALHVAVKLNGVSRQTVKMLIDAGSDVSAQDYKGKTPLICTVSGSPDAYELAKMLLEGGSDVNICLADQRTALHIAAGRCRPNIIPLLLKAGALVSAPDRHGWTPLHCAVCGSDGASHKVRMLVEAGAAVCAKTTKNRTPLHLAVKSAKESSVTLTYLIEEVGKPATHRTPKAVSIDYQDPSAVIEDPYIDVIKLLLKAGAELSLKDSRGLTPLDLAKGYLLRIGCYFRYH